MPGLSSRTAWYASHVFPCEHASPRKQGEADAELAEVPARVKVVVGLGVWQTLAPRTKLAKPNGR